MNQQLLQYLTRITEEEQKILNGQSRVDRTLYTEMSDFIIDSKKMLGNDKLIDVRPNTRFVHFPRHRHNYIEIMYMCTGQTTHIINSSTKVVLKAGDLLFFNQRTFHEILPASETDVGVNFIVLPGFFDVAFSMIEKNSTIGQFLVSTLCQEENEGRYLYFNAADIVPVQNLVENLIWSIVNKENGNRKINEYTMGLLFMQLLNRADRIDNGEIDRYENRLVFTILKYIEDHYQEACFTDLAQQLHQSVYRLSKLLKNSTGNTFKELLQQKRMHKAVQLLSDTDLSISDIIKAIGYENTSYFYRVFEDAYGMSPKGYRDKKLSCRCK